MKHSRLAVLLVLLLVSALFLMRRLTPQPAITIPMFLDREEIPGAVLAIRSSDGTVATRVYGRAAADTAEPLNETTLFPIASLSKPITAAAVRELVEQKKLNLDDRLLDVLPDLPSPQDRRFHDITIQHLLQHSSGLTQTPEDPIFKSGELTQCANAIQLSLQRSLDSPPGRTVKYSNSGYCYLGRVIERISKSDYESATAQLLGIKVPSISLMIGPPPPDSKRSFERALIGEASWRGIDSVGGWFADATSLAALFGQDARDPTILADEVATGAYYYGLGWRVWPSSNGYRLTHYGNLPGAFSVAVAYPDGRSAVILFNGRPKHPEAAFMNVAEALEHEMSREGPKAVMGTRAQSRKGSAPSRLDLP